MPSHVLFPSVHLPPTQHRPHPEQKEETFPQKRKIAAVGNVDRRRRRSRCCGRIGGCDFGRHLGTLPHAAIRARGACGSDARVLPNCCGRARALLGGLARFGRVEGVGMMDRVFCGGDGRAGKMKNGFVSVASWHV